MYWVVKRRGEGSCYLGMLPPFKEGPWRQHRKEAVKFYTRALASFFALHMRVNEWDNAYVVRVVKK